MKRLDLNIKLDEEVQRQEENGVDKDGKPKFKTVVVSPVEVAIQWLGVMLERAINQPKTDPRTGRLMPTVEVGMAVQRKYFRVMDTLEKHKDGIVEMEDDDFSFLDSKFHQAEISVQREVNKLLVKIDDCLQKAKMEKKEG